MDIVKVRRRTVEMSSRTKNASPPFTLAGQGQVPAGPHQGLLQGRGARLHGGGQGGEGGHGPGLAPGRGPRQGGPDEILSTAGSEAGSVLCSEDNQESHGGPDMEVDAALVDGEAQPEVFAVQ